MSNSEAVISFVKRRKSNLIKVFGGKCCICGFDKWQSALEFHHVIPGEKSFAITTETTTRSIETQLAELKKCILVCANCHRGIHAQALSVPDNWQDFYDDQIAQQLIEETHAKKYYCPICGKEKSRYGKLCASCTKTASRTVERPSRETLKQLIRTQTFVKIGLMYDVTDNAIKKWCAAENLPSRKKDINKYTDDEWEKI